MIIFNNFKEREIDKLHEINHLINILSLTNKNYPPQMENITTYGITLLNFFYHITVNILNEVIKIKESEVIL
ncbi:conserved Plasmodium protein, unknown function [Plasmodium relictum]|uniref:Uncharacterized protein n=1 Tax=Plasmodium relictum TaxID=85471 RepID=A0A1J1H6M0_PLARL|nr:conserved Plasmodium protein, unknown function [Plasmodium relictum]CRH00568.1 conserved Plasmodium protein, unknown function [Plasmodium relictum]